MLSMCKDLNRIKLNMDNMAKKQVTVNLDEEILEWIELKIKEKQFATRSHGIEYAITHLMKEEVNLGKQGNYEVPCSA
jgi:metal-responsive CopG/Arc/MetJ family transcriptional regulator